MRDGNWSRANYTRVNATYDHEKWWQHATACYLSVVVIFQLPERSSVSTRS
ncbi:MAG: sarcosine oxidase subunit delta [Verrucomicrobia bacterium]|nr:sarcosine oxidase subunit delta [Verrucomicrobiota bacterium]